LAEVILPNGNLERYGYNAHGIRISRAFNGSKRVLVLDGQNVLREIDNNGITLASWTHSSNKWGSLLAEHRGGSTFTFVHDAASNTRFLTNSKGGITTEFIYDAFGLQRRAAGPNQTTPFQFAGEYGYWWDGDERYYVRARHLHTGRGRWNSRDPIGILAGDANFYRNVGNAEGMIDPSGLVLSSPYRHWTESWSTTPISGGLPQPRPAIAPWGTTSPSVAEVAYKWGLTNTPAVRAATYGACMAMTTSVTTCGFGWQNWLSNTGAEWDLDMATVFRKSPHSALSDCNSFMAGAAEWIKTNKPTSKTAIVSQRERGGIPKSEDADYYWAIGGYQQYAYAQIFPTCGSTYRVHFTMRLEDIFTFSKFGFANIDKFHAEGLAHDFYTTGEFDKTFVYDRTGLFGGKCI